MRVLDRPLSLACAAGVLFASGTQLRAQGGDPGRYDVVWDSPSADASGSMPLGNGDIGLNAWMEPDGSLVFYIGKTDSWGDNGRLLKVGRLRIATDPPLSTAAGFEQRLSLGEGAMVVRCGEGIDATTTTLWVDANHPAVHVTIDGERERSATAAIELWRTQRAPYPECEVSDLLEDRAEPDRRHAPIFVEPDTLLAGLADRVGWYHFNAKSVGPALTAELQGLSDWFEGRPDPLLRRIFGAFVTATDGARVDDRHLSTRPSRAQRFSVFVSTEHPSSPEDWLANLNALATEIEQTPFDERRAAHAAWWRAFWERSWIHVTAAADADPDDAARDDAATVSRAYALQRWIDACAARGRYPIKFNGSIFTVAHPGRFGDADYRRWGPGYWWQNTRLPYLSMCASGDAEMMRPLFRMYAEELMPLHRFRTARYTGHGGAFLPECIYFFGPTFTATYGWTPFAERGEDKLQESPWHKWEWVGGLELVWMMLDYCEHTQDDGYAREVLIPTAREILTFFEQHFALDDDGKLVMFPSQSLETWWDCTNPAPEVAGLLAVTARLLALPEGLSSEPERAFWRRVRDMTPTLPTRELDGALLLAPAERFANKSNVENPELYPVFPFRLVSFEKANAELGLRALDARQDRGASGWRQDDLFMTHLGLAEPACEQLVRRARDQHAGSRFPAFWGPNYDWIPDQDHGGVLMRALQTMLMQTEGRAIHLLPAWPPAWEAEFKLHAPYRTTVSGKVRDGRVVDLEVVPESRRADVVLHAAATAR